jgi:hypothetical protein
MSLEGPAPTAQMLAEEGAATPNRMPGGLATCFHVWLTVSILPHISNMRFRGCTCARADPQLGQRCFQPAGAQPVGRRCRDYAGAGEGSDEETKPGRSY